VDDNKLMAVIMVCATVIVVVSCIVCGVAFL
jgi:hypothetical protein